MTVTGRPNLTGDKVQPLSHAAAQFLESKSESTGKAYRACLRRFKAFYPRGLDGYIAEIEAEIQENRGKPLTERVRPGEATVRGFIKWMDEQGYANKSIRQAVAALQNALKYYGITISTSFIELPPDRPMKENEKHQWTLDQVRQYVEAAEYLRDKCYILFQVQSGLGIGDIVELDYGDIQREYEAGVSPLLIHKFRKKTGVELKTFVGHDTVQMLKMYLGSRPNLKPGDPIFTMLGSDARATPGALNKKLREYADKLDFVYEEDLENGYSPVRSHSLRAAFRSRLTGKVDDTLIEFWMGHDIGDQVKTYINMPHDDLRELYANIEHLLSIEKTSRDAREEQSRDAIPETAMKVIREQGQRVAELEARLYTLTEEMEEQRRRQDETLRLLYRYLPRAEE